MFIYDTVTTVLYYHIIIPYTWTLPHQARPFISILIVTVTVIVIIIITIMIRIIINLFNQIITYNSFLARQRSFVALSLLTISPVSEFRSVRPPA